MITIIISGWFVSNQIGPLDIPSNKNDQYAAKQKWEINERTDIDKCEKTVLINRIDAGRALRREVAAQSFEKQVFAMFVIVMQIVILIVVSLMPRKIENV
ncbi:hypothetical protein [Soonwooa sp.]|uniref:hypothetical protein n=1 Tax=Soonwooa sp. TaxID=1938592 RepID=UPI002899F901|nr:hypothetical protein [Soonwooa sp.]